jgi:hypothetical protein
MGNLVATKTQNMEVHQKGKSHSKKYHQNISNAKKQIKDAEDSMKKMD